MNKSSQMTMLAFLAYDDFFQTDKSKLEARLNRTLMSVSKALDFTDICWGPVASKNNHEVFSDSLIYVVSHSDSEYSLVIRGTNPVSLQSWLFQDLNVAGQVPWSRQSEHTHATHAYISKATDTAMRIHKNLADKGTTVLQWLSNILSNTDSTIKLNVLGHSLGGLMSTTFGLWLYDEIQYQGLGAQLEMEVYSFAGPTAGNIAFKNHTDTSILYHSYRNNLDIATHVWDQQDMAENLLSIYGEIQLKPAELKVYDFLISEIAGLGYEKLGQNIDVPSNVCENPLFSDYFVQAGYQHVVPYLKKAFKDAPIKVIEIVIKLILNLFRNTQAASVIENELSDFASTEVSI